MGIRKWPTPGAIKEGGYISPDELGSGKGSPQGKKFLTDNQTFDNVDATQIDSGAATAGQVLTADGAGGASWQDGGATRTIRYYTSSDTWTKPSGLLGVFVVCLGAGGGAGSGRRGAAGTNRGGGAAGSGSAIVWRYIPESDLASTESVTIAATAGGGAAQTTDDTNGNPGTAGGDTSFGSLVVADGGSAGAGGIAGVAAAVDGGIAANCTPARGPYALQGVRGGNGTAGTGTSPQGEGFDPTNFYGQGCPGGAGGAGINSGNSEANGGSGNSIYNNGILEGGGTAGVANGVRDGADGSDNVVTNIDFYTASTLTHGIGTHGGSGASESDGVTAAGNGGNGGLYGVGGSGGGASANGANSGAGGDGSQGLCIVIEYTG